MTGELDTPRGGKIVGFHTTFNIKCTEYGFNFGLEAVNDDIQIIASVEAGKK